MVVLRDSPLKKEPSLAVVFAFWRALLAQHDWWGSSDKYLSNPFFSVDYSKLRMKD